MLLSRCRLYAKRWRDFIINDRVDVALASHADGFIWGRMISHPPCQKTSRRRGHYRWISRYLGRGSHLFIGRCRLYGLVLSTHALKGRCWPSGRAWPLKQVVDKIALPIIAIGGITRDNAPMVIQTGVHGIAVISAVCCQKDPMEAAKCLRRLLEDDQHD